MFGSTSLAILVRSGREKVRWCGAFGRHPEELAEHLDRGQARGDGHLLRRSGDGVVERPGVAGLEFRYIWREVRVRNLLQKAHRHEPGGESIMDYGLRLEVKQIPLLETIDFGGEAAEVLLEPEHGAGELDPVVQARRVPAVERDHVVPEGQVVADEDGEARAQLDGHGPVVRGAQPQGGRARRRCRRRRAQRRRGGGARRGGGRSAPLRCGSGSVAGLGQACPSARRAESV